MKLFVPNIGTLLRLTEAWTFPLHYEARNESLGKYLDVVPPAASAPNGRMYSEGHWRRYGSAVNASTDVTLPPDAVLRVDRIYLRRGGEDYASLTFTLVDMPKQDVPRGKFGKRPRFWAKLEDVNRIYCLVEPSE